MNKKSSKRTFFWQSTKLELWKLKRLERWTHDKTDLQAAKVEASPETELANLLQPINNSQNKGRSQVEEVTKFYNFNRLHWRLAPPYLKCFRKKILHGWNCPYKKHFSKQHWKYSHNPIKTTLQLLKGLMTKLPQLFFDSGNKTATENFL